MSLASNAAKSWPTIGRRCELENRSRKFALPSKHSLAIAEPSARGLRRQASKDDRALSAGCGWQIRRFANPRLLSQHRKGDCLFGIGIDPEFGRAADVQF